MDDPLPFDADAQVLPPPDPLGRRFADDEVAGPWASEGPRHEGPRALALPDAALARLIGAARSGEVLLLGGAPDLLNACAHAFLVEAVGERPSHAAGRNALGPEPRALVVDGGNSVSPYLFAATAKRRGEDAEFLLPRVRLARAFTAYQFVALLGDALEREAKERPCSLVVVLSVRSLFEDQDLGASEARQLARRACAGFQAFARRARVPFVVTSPSPSMEPRAQSIERIVREYATRVVPDLRFEAVPGAVEGGARPPHAGQQALEVWGNMPPREALVGPPAERVEGGILIRAHWRPKRAAVAPGTPA